MLTADTFPLHRDTVTRSPDLTALSDRLTARCRPWITSPLQVPRLKALLSVDGGVCPGDGTPLRFDPHSPDAHECPACRTVYRGIRHDRHWARGQHLWLAERAAHLATVGVTAENDDALQAARDLVLAYPEVYFELPNQDNVLGPSHLFFSTYLESIWLQHYLTAAFLLREADALGERDLDRISALVEESSTLIGEFNEGMSNRQTWHAAALTAIAVWFEDEDLARLAIEGRTGLLGHLTDGFGHDGLWFEGENYHLFAMQGLLRGLAWARLAGVDYTADPALATLLGQALLAPARTALPDGTFPARKDARYGVSLAHPAYLECWEAGRAWLPEAREALDSWLAHLYRLPAPAAQGYDAWLHEAGEEPPESRSRSDLSYWALLTMDPEGPATDAAWNPRGTYFADQGLAVLRHDDRYISLECTSSGEGHGHADRLHLTLHSGGVHWLPDPGTGSYVSPTLPWYRSALAHNVPLLDGTPLTGDGYAETYDHDDTTGIGWVRSRSGPVTRSVVAGPAWVVDLVSLDAGATASQLEVLWHPAGELRVEPDSGWTAATLDDSQATNAETCAVDTGIRVHAREGETAMALHFPGASHLLRARGPGLPGGEPRIFLRRDTSVTGEGARQVAVCDLAPEDPSTGIREVRATAERVTLVHRDARETTVQIEARGAQVTGPTAGHGIRLEGGLPRPAKHRPLFSPKPPWETSGAAIGVGDPPTLDGTLDGFVTDDPLFLDDEHQYRRSENPWEGPGQFRAEAHVNWDAETVYLAVVVQKPDLVIRGDDAPALLLDNEPDDIHGEGIQVYLQVEDEAPRGWLIVPSDDGRIRVRPASGTAGHAAEVHGAWQPIEGEEPGYCLTAAIDCPTLGSLPLHARIRFDLLVNEPRADRERRAGQLVWSGASGWIYLRGDRHAVEEYGWLDLT